VSENVGASGLLARRKRKRKTGVLVFAQLMLKRPQRLLRASGSLLAGKEFNRRPTSHCEDPRVR